MNIVKVEPTPNPNSMRVMLDKELPAGTSYNFTKRQAADAPEPVASILQVEGVQGIYHVMDFMAVERSGDVEWEKIIADIQEVMKDL